MRIPFYKGHPVKGDSIHMRKLAYIFFLFIIISSVFDHATLYAQSETSHLQYVAGNPIFIPFGTINLEYERSLGTHTTAGISGWYEYHDVKARWVYAKYMYYPGGTPLKGFACGLTAGILRGYRGDDEEKTVKEKEDTPTAGVMFQYNWLFGKKKRLLAGIGVGARSALNDIDDNSPMERFDGDGRLELGWLF